MPAASQSYRVTGTEVISIINPANDTPTGTLLYNQLITPQSVRRLGLLSKAWQRINWNRLHIELVTLNGSLVQSGYTMALIEDPEITLPTTASEVIPFMTALRAATVRQNWVMSKAGNTVSVGLLPHMYTKLGTDIRRYSPGRLAIALAGHTGVDTTFQIMMHYDVSLYIPIAEVAGSTPPIPCPEPDFILNGNLTGPVLSVAGSDSPYVTCSQAIPAAGSYQFFDKVPRYITVKGPESGGAIPIVQVPIYGFISVVPGGTFAQWGAGTKYMASLTDNVGTAWPGVGDSDGEASDTVPVWCYNATIFSADWPEPPGPLAEPIIIAASGTGFTKIV